MKKLLLPLLLFGFMAASVNAAELTTEDKRLLEMKPEELLGSELTSPSVSKYWEEQGATSVSKKGEDPFNTPAAVYIISSEDIRRSGVTSVMEALRMAPGVQVARIDSNKWAISIRGFNRQFSDKLRVMIDGRPIYTNLFSGVFWDDHDIPLEEVERIEVIRGSGGTAWGTNSFNGVINIITKHSKDSQEHHVSALFGNEERGSIYAREGGKLSNAENGFYRIYTKYSGHDSTNGLSGDDLNNDWHNVQSGFRLDSDSPGGEGFNLRGEIYRNKVNNYVNAFPTLTPPFFDPTGHNKDSYGTSISSQWSKPLEDNSSLLLKADLSYFNMSVADFLLESVVYDTEFQHFLNPTDSQELTWGAGYRLYYDDIDNSFYLTYSPSHSFDNVFSSFVQDKIWLIDDLAALTIGSKFEYFDQSGFDYQPSIRLSFYPSKDHTIWAAVSKLTKLPTRGSGDVTREILSGTPSGYISGSAKQNIDSDKMLSYELGYKTKPTQALNLDFTLFFNDYYDDLYSTSFVPGGISSDVILTAYGNNDGKAKSYGFEVAASYQVNPSLKIEPGYGFLVTKQEPTAILYDDRPGFPKHQLNLRTQYNIASNLFLDNSIYYVDGLNNERIPDYTRVDARLAWNPIHGLELSLVGQNLLDDKHQEYSPDVFAQPSEIGRSVYVKAAWEF